MPRKSILTLLGTRPEVIKLAPILLHFEQHADAIRALNVASGQHPDLIYPFIDLFGIRVDRDLGPMAPNQDPVALLHRVVREVAFILNRGQFDLILVQGDTTTALAGALAGHMCAVPVAHVEAGLRSGNLRSPYPEEMNRISITQLATLHFAATARNRRALLSEGVREEAVFVTGNPVVDAIQLARRRRPSSATSELMTRIAGRRYIVLTTHRRESFGPALRANLQVLRSFIQEHEDIVLVFPVHPNPNVSVPASEILAGHPRIILTSPLPYPDFLQLVSESWLVVSDSGGIQEEVPSLGKPLLILRENTERPECIEAGIARLVGGSPLALHRRLQEACLPGSWVHAVHKSPNPFGKGDSARRIFACLTDFLDGRIALSDGRGTYRPPSVVRDPAPSLYAC
jgi:UDP-N-acetylglucosamine 2-epimerase (non-hydrolysing)